MPSHYDGRIFDCDPHLYETDEAWNSIVPAKYRKDWGIRFTRGADGDFVLYVGPTNVQISAGHLREDGKVPAPGRLHDWLRAQKEGKDQIDFFVAPTADMVGPEARLRKMDEFGVEGCLLFPVISSVQSVISMSWKQPMPFFTVTTNGSPIPGASTIETEYSQRRF